MSEQFEESAASLALASGVDGDPIADRVIEIIVDHLLEDAEDAVARSDLELRVRGGANLWSELGADSLGEVEICMFLEEEYGIVIYDEEFPTGTITAYLCIDLVRAKLAARSRAAAHGQ